MICRFNIQNLKIQNIKIFIQNIKMSSGHTIKLNSGYEIDVVGLGTWKVNRN